MTLPSEFETKIYRHLLKVRPTILVDLLKSMIGIKRVILDTAYGHFWIDPVSHLGQILMSQGHYEPSTTKVLQDCLLSGGTFIDVGANEGYFSVIGAALAGPSGRVIAIEPQQRLIPVIQRNIALNDLKNVEVLNIAVSDGTKSSMDIWLSPSTQSGSSSFVTKYFVAKSQTVACRTLDDLFVELLLDRVDLIKIDVEGFEPEVLWGASDVLRNHRITFLLVDFHGRHLQHRGIDPNALHQFVLGHGYKLVNSDFTGDGYNLYTSASANLGAT